MSDELELRHGCLVMLANGSIVGPIARTVDEESLYRWRWKASPDVRTLMWTKEGRCLQGDLLNIVEVLSLRVSKLEPSTPPGVFEPVSPNERLATFADIRAAVADIIAALRPAPYQPMPVIGANLSLSDAQSLKRTADILAKVESSKRYGKFGGIVGSEKPSDESEIGLSPSENDAGGHSDFEAYRERAKAALKVWLNSDQERHLRYLRDWLIRRQYGKVADIKESSVIDDLMIHLLIWYSVNISLPNPQIGDVFKGNHGIWYRIQGGISPDRKSAICSIVEDPDESAPSSPPSEKPEGGQSEPVDISMDEFCQIAGRANRLGASPSGYNSIMVDELNKLISQKIAQRAC